MGLFSLAAAVMIGAALALIVPPLLGRRSPPSSTRTEVALSVHRDRLKELKEDHDADGLDEESYEQAREELERAALEDLESPADAGAEQQPRDAHSPTMAVAIAVALPTLAFGLYMELGTPQAALKSTAPPSTATSPGNPANGDPMPSIPEMVGRLEARLRNNPEDGEGWYMLGRSYTTLDRLPEAKVAYAEAYRLLPGEPAVMLGYAEVLARLNDNSFAGRPSELIDEAVALDPGGKRTLWLAGVAAFQQGDGKKAVAAWQQLRKSPELSSEEVSALDGFIRRAQGAPAEMPRSAPAGTERPPADAGKTVQAKISLAPELVSQAAPTDTVYIFARATTGPRMPLAIIRTQVQALPMDVVLDDSMGMSPSARLSDAHEVFVGARISKSGNATPSPGDMEGLSGAVAPGSQAPVQVSINRVIP